MFGRKKSNGGTNNQPSVVMRRQPVNPQDGRPIGRLRAILQAATGPLPKVAIAPRNVKVTLTDGRVITPVLVKVPNLNPLKPDFWMAYGPESIGEFEGASVWCDSIVEGDTLVVALFRVQGSHMFRFAPVPIDMVERTTYVNGHTTNAITSTTTMQTEGAPSA